MESVLKVVGVTICLALVAAEDPQECTGGAVWTDCGMSQASCWTNCTRRVVPQLCTTECYTGCLCPEGTLMHEGTCITPDECPELPPCHEKLATMSGGLLGAFVPSCNEDGYYAPQQCHGSTGYCWCTTTKGEEIPNSRTGPGTDEVECKEIDELAPCHEKLATMSKNVQPMPGAFIPSCNEDGYYTPQQCHGSTGHCWCAKNNGEEIDDTRTGPGEERVDCVALLGDAEMDASSVMTLSLVLQIMVAMVVGLLATL